jgi:hypothetical protein
VYGLASVRGLPTFTAGSWLNSETGHSRYNPQHIQAKADKNRHNDSSIEKTRLLNMLDTTLTFS